MHFLFFAGRVAEQKIKVRNLIPTQRKPEIRRKNKPKQKQTKKKGAHEQIADPSM